MRTDLVAYTAQVIGFSTTPIGQAMIKAMVGTADDTDPITALQLLTGALYFRLLLTRQPIDDDITGHFVDVLIRGFAPPAQR